MKKTGAKFIVVHIRFVQVVAFLDSSIIDFGVLANLFCNARDVAGIFELYHEMVMWLFEVAYLPIRAVAVMVFAVVEKFLLGMCIFVMQCPCARPVSLNVVDCGLLALWVENEHELIGFWAFCAWFWHLYHLCCLILAWNLAFLGRSAKECRESRQNCGAAPDTR